MRPSRSALVVVVLATLFAAPGVVAQTDAADPAGSSFDLGVFASQYLSLIDQYQRLGAQGEIAVPPVRITGEMSFQNDEKYGVAQADYWLGFNATINQGGIELAHGPFRVQAGRFRHHDAVASPYSLVVSSQPLSALLVDLSFETDRLFYTTRWLDLNRSSALGYPDRGANIRTYGVRFDALRVGFQDVLVYAGRRFDFEYLANPVPGFFLQYVKISAGAPWTETGNDNSIIGFFADYTVPGIYGYGQILIDDINTNAILYPESYQNPSKIGWSLGGRYRLPVGTLGFYHAGATKYTFQAYGGGSVGAASDEKYGYTYYPAVEYEVDGEPRAIEPEDNYIGYRNGENNVAFLADYTARFDPVDLLASLELVVTGSQSPANPWHQYTTWQQGGDGAKLLDDERLETELTARVRADLPRERWSVFADLELGFVANELELVDVPDEYRSEPNNSIRYFAPGEADRFFARLEIGGAYRFTLVR